MRSIRVNDPGRAAFGVAAARRRARVIAWAALFALAAGCGRTGVLPPLGKRGDGPPRHGGTLRSATFAEPRNLDPATAFEESAKVFEQLLYEPLVDYDPNNQIVGRVAERFERSPDGLRYDFHLRRGARFHDGDEITADDVKRSIERTLAHDTPCPAPTFYAKIAGYAPFHDGSAAAGRERTYTPHLDGVVVDSPYDLHVDLSEPDATFLSVMTLPFMAPLCKSAGATYRRDWQFRGCGAGAFKLESWEPGQRIRLLRHDGFFEPGKPYLDAIEWYLLMPTLTQRFKFEAGALDMIRELPIPDGIAYRTDPAWTPLGQSESGKSVGGFFMNTQMPPFDNVELRRAVAAAIDWDQIASISLNTVSTHQMVPHAIAEYDPPFEGQKYDAAAARAHMKRAGYPYDPATGKGGYPQTITIEVYADGFGLTTAQLAAQQLAKIGIAIDIKVVSWPTFLAETEQRGHVQMGYAGWSMDYPDPSDFFEPILSSEAIIEEGSQNAAFFSNHELDELLRRAHRELDGKARLAMYRRCEEIVRDEAPWTLGYVYRYYEVVQPYVHDYVVDRSHTQPVRDIWLEPRPEGE